MTFPKVGKLQAPSLKAELTVRSGEAHTKYREKLKNKREETNRFELVYPGECAVFPLRGTISKRIFTYLLPVE